MIGAVQPCDAGVIGSTRGAGSCKLSSKPRVIAAIALGSGMAFLDSAVPNVALPTNQAGPREVGVFDGGDIARHYATPPALGRPAGGLLELGVVPLAGRGVMQA